MCLSCNCTCQQTRQKCHVSHQNQAEVAWNGTTFAKSNMAAKNVKSRIFCSVKLKVGSCSPKTPLSHYSFGRSVKLLLTTPDNVMDGFIHRRGIKRESTKHNDNNNHQQPQSVIHLIDTIAICTND